VWGYDWFPTTSPSTTHIVKLRKSNQDTPRNPTMFTSFRAVGYKFHARAEKT